MGDYQQVSTDRDAAGRPTCSEQIGTVRTRFVNGVVPYRMSAALQRLRKVNDKIQFSLKRYTVCELPEPLKADIETLREFLRRLEQAVEAEKNAANSQWVPQGEGKATTIHGRIPGGLMARVCME